MPDSEWVAVALLGKPRGNRGELTAFALTSKLERYQTLCEVYLPNGERLEVEEVWLHGGVPIFKFKGVNSISEAERLAGAELRVPLSERAPLEPGEFFESDLIGCEVVDHRTGARLGRVEGWQDGGGSGLLAIEGGWLLPFARTICVDIDLAAKRIAVDLPDGLRELNR